MDDQRLISTGVSVEGSFPVDVLKVKVTISGERATKEDCAVAYNEHLTDVRTSLVWAGVPERDIRNSSFFVRGNMKTLYVRDDDQGDLPKTGASTQKQHDGHAYYVAKTVADGYRYGATVELECGPSAELAKRIWAALIGCGDEVQFDFEFDVKDKEAARSSLLADAIAEGRKRASVLAAAAGAAITGIHSIEYDYTHDRDRQAEFLMRSGRPMDVAPDFNPSDVTLTCRIQMQWRVALI